MKQLFAIAVPVLPGKEEALKDFIKELTGARKQEFEASRRRMGVRERAFLQSTPMGQLVVVTLEGENPQDAFASFGKGDDEFTKWFISNVTALHGVDLNASPDLVMPELIADSGKLPEVVGA